MHQNAQFHASGTFLQAEIACKFSIFLRVAFLPETSVISRELDLGHLPKILKFVMASVSFLKME